MYQSKHLVGLQALRFFAAVLVIAHHSQNNLASYGRHGPYSTFAFGNAGVDIFFVLSGFLMVHRAIDRQGRTTQTWAQRMIQFWKNRVIRIAPIYWVWTCFYAGLLLLLPALAAGQEFSLTYFLKSLFFIPEFHIDPATSKMVWPLLIPGWTLNYEMFFYLLFGACLTVPRLKYGYALFAAVFLALVLWGQWHRPVTPVGITYTDALLLEFLFGGLLAFAVRRFRLPGLGASAGLILFALLALGLSEFTMPDEVHRVLKYGPSAVLLVLGFLGLEPLLQGKRRLALLGDASYSIYLTHAFTLPAAGIVWGASGLILPFAAEIGLLALILVGAVGVGVLAFQLIERPLIALLMTRRLRGAVAV